MAFAVANHGYLPAARYIINHDIMNCTADGVAGNEYYSGRALGLSEPWDMIQLHPDLEPLWDDICAHYDRVGLQHAHDVVWHVYREELGEHIGFRPSVFFFGPQECCFWGDNQWMETVEFINSKNNFIAVAEALNVEVPDTRCFDSAADVSDADIRSTVFPCYAKAAVSVSGVGIYRCRNGAELHHALARFDEGTPIQIQEEIVADTFLNMQYHVVGKRLFHMQASEQILDGFAHQGNRVPARYEPWSVVDPLAEWLLERGMKGVFAFDVAVTRTADGVRFPVIECNPRFNGASYPTAVAQKLDIPEWSAVSLHTRHRALANVDLSGIEFDPATGQGVVLVNWGTILAGKLLVLLAGSPDYQASLLAQLRLRL
jgi:hypothetical protein